MTPYYQDGAVTLFLGDARDVLPNLERESVTLLWTDPPYGHSNGSGDLQATRVGVAGARQRPTEAIQNDTPELMREAVDGALAASVGILRADCCCCCGCCGCCCCGGGGPTPTFAWVANRMDSDGLAFFHAVIWDKSARGNGLGWRFRRNYEMVMVAHRTGGRLAWRDGDLAVPNIQQDMPVGDRQHPNQKPESLVAKFIDWTTLPGDVVLDPFCGSGTTLRAAKDLGRKAIGIEIEEKYAEIAARRCAQEVLNL